MLLAQKMQEQWRPGWSRQWNEDIEKDESSLISHASSVESEWLLTTVHLTHCYPHPSLWALVRTSSGNTCHCGEKSMLCIHTTKMEWQ